MSINDTTIKLLLNATINENEKNLIHNKRIETKKQKQMENHFEFACKTYRKKENRIGFDFIVRVLFSLYKDVHSTNHGIYQNWN